MGRASLLSGVVRLIGGLEARSALRTAAFRETGWILLYIMLCCTFRLAGRFWVVEASAG